MATFVLVHGAWHGAWCWELVVPALAERGHRGIAVELPGMRFAGDAIADASLAGWTEHVAAVVRSVEGPVVLVGHSRGGLVISQVAELVPERVAALIYLTAVLLPDGGRVIDVMSTLPPESLAAMHMAADGASSTLDPDLALDLMYNATEPALARRMIAQLVPDPMLVAAEPLRLTDARYGSVRRCFVECLRDQTLDIALQRSMQAALPCAAVATLDTDHSPFASDVDTLVASLIELGAGHRRGVRTGR